jgi:hypothetical protein
MRNGADQFNYKITALSSNLNQKQCLPLPLPLRARYANGKAFAQRLPLGLSA